MVVVMLKSSVISSKEIKVIKFGEDCFIIEFKYDAISYQRYVRSMASMEQRRKIMVCSVIRSEGSS